MTLEIREKAYDETKDMSFEEFKMYIYSRLQKKIGCLDSNFVKERFPYL